MSNTGSAWAITRARGSWQSADNNPDQIGIWKCCMIYIYTTPIELINPGTVHLEFQRIILLLFVMEIQDWKLLVLLCGCGPAVCRVPSISSNKMARLWSVSVIFFFLAKWFGNFFVVWLKRSPLVSNEETRAPVYSCVSATYRVPPDEWKARKWNLWIKIWVSFLKLFCFFAQMIVANLSQEKIAATMTKVLFPSLS